MEEIIRRILEAAATGFAGDQVMKRTGLGERAEGILDKIIPPAAAADASAIPQDLIPADTVMTPAQEQQVMQSADMYNGAPYRENGEPVGANALLPYSAREAQVTQMRPTQLPDISMPGTAEDRANSVQDFVRNAAVGTQQLLKEVPEEVQADPQAQKGAAALSTAYLLKAKAMADNERAQMTGELPSEEPDVETDSFLSKMFGNEEMMLTLALGFNSMRLQPDQGLAAVIGKRLETLQAGRGSGATISELIKMGRADLARLVKSGQITPKEALTMALKQPKTSWSTMTGAELKKKFPGQFSQYADDEMFNVSSQGEVKPLYAEPIGKTMGTEAAKASIETVTPIYQNALVAPKAIENLDRTIDIIQKQPINSGLFLDLKNLRDKLLTEFGSKDAVERLTWTQITNSRLGSEVFQLFSALGLGARGMDTPAEREFMREVLTGNLSMTPQALVALAKSRRETQIEALRKYNMFADSPAMKQYSSGLVTLPKFDLSKYVPVVTPAMMGK